METLVSVITPAYNAARRLRDCVESIRSQSFQNWEHVVVDDGSTDATWALLTELQAEDARLKAIQQVNAAQPGQPDIDEQHVRLRIGAGYEPALGLFAAGEPHHAVPRFTESQHEIRRNLLVILDE